MHNAAFAALGIDAVYLPLETGSAADFFDAAEALGLAGASVTIPLKRDLLTGDRAVEVDELPRRVGALNTLKRYADRWEGRNFDVDGFLAPLRARAVELPGRKAVVLGAGGAARAAVAGLRSAGADVAIAARRPEAAAQLARELGASATAWPPAGWDLLVNTTPVGMWPRVEESPLDGSAVAALEGTVVYDMVYNPEETALLRHARAGGALVIGGLEMLVGQACLQFAWWTGREAPRDVMMRAASDFVRHLS
jgi:shikimate dehydrogenase